MNRQQFETQLRQKLSQKQASNTSEEGVLQRAFKFFDYANKGEVDFPTFVKAISKIGVIVEENDLANFFRQYDQNGNGSLDYKEFSDIVFNKAQADSQSQASPRFRGNTDSDPRCSPKVYLEAFRDALKRRGARGMIGLQRSFKIMDDNRSHSLDKYEFKKAVKDFRVDVPDQGIDILFNAFDINRDGSISYDEFLRMVRGPLRPNRLNLVKKAFQILDKDGSGIVDINDIKDTYRTDKHPDVISGKKTNDQVLTEFLETFEQHHCTMHNEQPDGQITPEEWIEYYTNVSASLDNDEYFALMMNNSWNLNGKAETYKKHEKGWANKSPEKANQFAGEPHKGYAPGQEPVRMVQQRSGMMSSQNPLSTTNKFYVNNYDSHRQTPSVANTKANYAEPEKGHYQRTGHESNNNPLAKPAPEAYSKFTGKPIQEKVEAPVVPLPKYVTYAVSRIRDRIVARGERGLFGLRRSFQMMDSNGNGTLEFREFKRAITDFKIDLEEEDIQNLFKAFDRNGDGVVDLTEFMGLVLGKMNSARQNVVNAAWEKLSGGNNTVPLAKIKNTYDGSKHPDACNGRKTADEAVSDFLEVYDMHHNGFNNYSKNPNVSCEEFEQYYQTLSPSHEEDLTFISLVKGVWGVKAQAADPSARGFAGGPDASASSRDRYIKNNSKGTPFGVSGAEQWSSATKDNFRPHTGAGDSRVAGSSTKQAQFVSSMQQQSNQNSSTGQALLEKFREKMRARGARGIMGLKRIFKIMDDDRSGCLDPEEFQEALKDYRVNITPEEGNKLFDIFDLNGDGNISYDEFLRGVVGEMNNNRKAFVTKAFKKLDKNGNGVVEVDDIKGTYNAKQHPDVKLGKKTEEEVLSEFLDTFELHYSFSHPNKKDRKIEFEEFVEYYNNISMSIEDDRYFELMMTNAWNLNNVSYGKGWGGEF